MIYQILKNFSDLKQMCFPMMFLLCIHTSIHLPL